jgi:hypothetical protein
MRRPDEPAALSEIAADAGLSLSDVAFIAELDESTVSRLWADPGWLDRVTGSSLQRMIASVPGVAEYVTAYSLASRLSRLITELADEGLDVDQAALETCRAEGVPAPYIANALQAALHTVRGDDAKVVSYMARFWGRDQDRALERLFSAGTGRLLASPGRLLSASAEMAPRLRRPAYSFHSILAEAALVHHAGRAAAADLELSPVRDRQDAMSLRSSVMGALIGRDDLDLARRYERMVAGSPVLGVVEEWAFPTYTRDARPEPGFTLSRSLLLRNTAAEIIREIRCYSDAYVYYLLAVYLPLALARDPTFGLSAGRLAAAVHQRRDHADDPRLRALYERTLQSLERAVSGD